MILNGGFESGQTSWQLSGPNIVSSPAHTGARSLEICNYNRCNDEAIQTVSLPGTFNQLSLSYWAWVTTKESPGSTCLDSLTVQVRTSTGIAIQTLATLCNRDATSTWVRRSADLTPILAAYAGKQVQLRFHGAGNSTRPTDFALDNISLLATTDDTSTSTTSAPSSTSTTSQSTTTSTTVATTTTTTTPPTTVPPAMWKPAVGATWQYQLQGAIDTTVGAAVFDIDGFDTPMSVIESLHRQGKRVVCYVSAGSWENWRPDASQFPSAILGQNNGWPGEKWLDVRAITTLKPLMEARVNQQCKAKGFDAVEWDNVDGYANNTGFPLTYQDQLVFNRMLADVAHRAGLSVGLKNDLDQVTDLVSSFDFAVNEQCNEYSECGTLAPFIQAGKPVFQVEYKLTTANFCPADIAARFSGIQKQLDLDAGVTPCQPY